MGKIIAIASQKGGVGKTTTAINLSTSIAVKGKKVLVIDSDPQASLTFGFGIRRNGEKIKGLYELYAGKAEFVEVSLKIFENLYIIPSKVDLFMAELEIFDTEERERRLKCIIDSFKVDFDYIFIDCPPSFSFLTLCALVASDSVLIPVQCEQFAVEALRVFIKLLWRIKANFNESLELEGILLTMFSKHLTLSRVILEDVKKVFRSKTFETIIPRNVALAEATQKGLPAVFYAPDAIGSLAYRQLASEFIAKQC
ncbi:MAG: ParA family protein [Thermodesulfovibrio sp.]|nr:ParA family protein [Thermodesulfovibrio sp.]